MSIASATTFESGITLRSTRKPVAIGMIAALSLTAIALIPVAVAAYTSSR